MSRRSPRPQQDAPAAKQQIRCAVYTRKSSEEGLEQEYNSLDAQRESAEAYIASQKTQGWTCLPQRYDDGGFSGGNMDRPAMARLLADIDAGQVDCVVVYKVDRLSRSLLDFARIMEAFDRHGVSFVSVTQHFNTTHSMGRLTLNILLSFAQFEREIIGERIRDKIAAQRRRGKWAGGIPILGYDVDRSGPSPKLVINAQEAARVRAILDLYLLKGSLLPVVQELARRGWVNKTWTTKHGIGRGGKGFDRCSLHKLLTNPLYAGQIRHKTELHAGEHQAIIAPDVFARVQAMLHGNGRGSGHHARNRHGALLRGLLHCKACGRAMTHTFTSKRGKQYRYYTCTHAIKSGHAACPGRSLPAAQIEKVVVDEIRGIGHDPDLVADVLAEPKQQHNDQVQKLESERRDLQREMRRHHDQIKKLAGATPTAATARELADLHERIRMGEARQVELVRLVAEQEQHRIDPAEAATALADFDNVWQRLSPKEQARLLWLLVAGVEYDARAGTVAVTFHATGMKTLATDHQQQHQEAA